MRDVPSMCRALAMYEIGDRDEAVRLMKSVLRRQPGYADLHVAIAADAWGRRDAETAEQVTPSSQHDATVLTAAGQKRLNKNDVIVTSTAPILNCR